MHSFGLTLCVGSTQLQAPGSVWYACIMHTQLVAAHASETRYSGCPVVASCGLSHSSMISFLSPAQHPILLQIVIHSLSFCMQHMQAAQKIMRV